VFPEIDFAIAGLGEVREAPAWVTDLTTWEIDDRTEKMWCKRYAESHVVIGVHGSNMLLPSAHAGAVIELVPSDRWSNLVQDTLVSQQDIREILCRYRFLPLEASAATVANVAIQLLHYIPTVMASFKKPWCDHKALQRDPWKVMRRKEEVAQGVGGP
jgi:hypothetical protein